MKARVGDRVKIEIYPASQLGAIPRMVEGVVTGTIEAFVTPYSFLVGTEPRYQVFDAIGVFEGPAHLNRILNDPQFRPRALALGESKGLQGIGSLLQQPGDRAVEEADPDARRLQGPEDPGVRDAVADRADEAARFDTRCRWRWAR